MRRALDSGAPFPEGADAHDAAAALLALFAALPQPLLPPEVAQVCDVCVPAVSDSWVRVCVCVEGGKGAGDLVCHYS